MSESLKETRRLKKVSERYNLDDDFDRYLMRYEGRTILRNLNRNSRVLELGCANGIVTEMLASRCSYLTAIDGSKDYIEEAKRRLNGRKNVNFQVSLFEEFDSRNKYDVIVMASVLEHVKNPRRVLKHLRRFLTRRGEMHITVPNAFSIHRQIGKALGMIKRLTELKERDHLIGHRRVYNKRRLIHDVQSSGLRVKKCSGIFMKPLSNAQMQHLSDEMLEQFYEMGKFFPDTCNYLYVIASKK